MASIASPTTPAAESDHESVGALEQVEHHLLLPRAEGVLALAVEEDLDRLAEPLLERAVGVERLPPELGRERPCAGGLAGAHEAHQHKRSRSYRSLLQPMRSSYAASAARASSM